jgi:hypothetical protein
MSGSVVQQGVGEKVPGSQRRPDGWKITGIREDGVVFGVLEDGGWRRREVHVLHRVRVLDI